VTRVELPDFALVLVFGDFNKRTPPVLGYEAICQPDDVAERLSARRLCVVDANELSKQELVRLASIAADGFARIYALAVATNAALVARRLSSLALMEVFDLPDPAAVTINLRPVSTDRRNEQGPFDIIGDVHGCGDELIELLGVLGYQVSFAGEADQRRAVVAAPPGRRAFFVGDLIDRGPRTTDVLAIVMAMVADGTALCVAGNHDAALLRWFEGRASHLKHGLEETVTSLLAESASFRAEVQQFIASLKGHLWVDDGKLAIAHAGIRETMIGRSSGRVRAFTLYGDTEPKPAADGLPTRYHWALGYQGPVSVVYGHTPVADVGWVNNTLCIDTGCCFGGRLTALRWPEREIVSVPARAIYATRGRAFGHPPARPD
jgi:hypothetical protein